jgi:hypothetical protein
MADHHLHDSDTVTHLHADRDGLPCFGCYFSAVYDALREDQLYEIKIKPGEDPHQAEIARRLGSALAYMADGIAAITMHAAGEDAEALLAVFTERLNNMLVLMRAPCDEQGH